MRESLWSAADSEAARGPLIRQINYLVTIGLKFHPRARTRAWKAREKARQMALVRWIMRGCDGRRRAGHHGAGAPVEACGSPRLVKSRRARAASTI